MQTRQCPFCRETLLTAKPMGNCWTWVAAIGPCPRNVWFDPEMSHLPSTGTQLRFPLVCLPLAKDFGGIKCEFASTACILALLRRWFRLTRRRGGSCGASECLWLFRSGMQCETQCIVPTCEAVHAYSRHPKNPVRSDFIDLWLHPYSARGVSAGARVSQSNERNGSQYQDAWYRQELFVLRTQETQTID